MEIRLACSESDYQKASALAAHVFQEIVAPTHSAEGIERFLKYAASLQERQNLAHWVFLAWEQDQLLGMSEIREYRHLAMLFVEPSHHNQGIGRCLLEAGIAFCHHHRPDLPQLTVNASPNSVTAYEHWGFVATGELHVLHGIAFVPMQKILESVY